MTRLYYGQAPDAEPAPDAEWIELKAEVAPISLARLRSVGFLTAVFGSKSDEYLRWIVASIAAWGLRGTDGKPLDSVPSVDGLLQLDPPRVKWLIEVLFRAAVGIPLA